MSGSYNLTLVFASYCVAVIAAYTAIYFGTRLFSMTGPARKFWLWTGAACLGTGIWSMHFVGMSAYTMPDGMEMSFSAPLTFASWVPAVLASALALTVITRPQVNALSIAASAIIMGAGISAMHYGGMYAMRMDPPIQYDTVILSLSVLIAVVASGAALVICRQVRVVPARYALPVKALAALVMGAAICGMHYTGMAAASYPMEAQMAGDNALRGDWMGIPTALVASVFLLFSLVVAYRDFRQAESERRAVQRREQQIHEDAFHDSVTGLGNRSFFEQFLMRQIAGKNSTFTLVCIEMLQFRELSQRESEADANALVRAFVEAIGAEFDQSQCTARLASARFALIVPPMAEKEFASACARLQKRIAMQSLAAEYGQWSLGFSHYPDTATNSRLLVREAQRPVYSFDNRPGVEAAPGAVSGGVSLTP